MDIRITQGIPKGKRRDISALVYSADPKIFRAVFGKDALHILNRSLNGKMIFVAMDGNKVVGVIGIASKDEKSLNITLSTIKEIKGVKFLKSFLLWQFIKSAPKRDELFIEFIAVKPQYRGKGIGTTLLKEAIAFAYREGFTRMRLFVREENTNAKRLYEKFGFVVEKTLQVPFPLNRLLSIERGYKMVLNLREVPGEVA